MPDNQEQSLLRRSFAEIILGYSVSKLDGAEIVFKHPTFLDSSRVDKYYDFYWGKGLNEGLETEKDKISSLIAADVWTRAKEDELINLNSFADTIRQNLNADNLIAPAQIKEQKRELESVSAKIKEINNERNQLLGLTLEEYVNNELNYIVVLAGLYKDIDFKNKLYTEEEIENLDIEDLQKIYSLYTDINMKFNIENIKKIIVSDFYYSRLDLAGGDTYKLFGRHIVNLTNYQYLLSYLGARYHSIITDTPNIPENVRYNYDKLIEWVKDNNKNAKNKITEEKPPELSLLEETKAAGKTKLNKNELMQKLRNM